MNDVTLAVEDANAKLFDIVAVADVSIVESIVYSLATIAFHSK